MSAVCPSCSGQLSSAGQVCPWCGAAPDGFGAEPTLAGQAPPSGPTKPDIGLGGRSVRPVPTLPPPPEDRPHTAWSPAQLALRVVIVVAGAYLLLIGARAAVTEIACRIPGSTLCR